MTEEIKVGLSEGTVTTSEALPHEEVITQGVARSAADCSYNECSTGECTKCKAVYEAFAMLKETLDTFEINREGALVATKIDEAILWFNEYVRVCKAK